MRRQADAAPRPDPFGGALHAPQRGWALFDEQREQVPVPGRDLDARDHLDAIASSRGPLAGFERCTGLVVISYRNHVEIGLSFDVIDQLTGAHEPVRGQRVQVHIGAAQGLVHATV